jgi:GTPase KRas protein
MGFVPEEYDPTDEQSFRKQSVVDNELVLFEISKSGFEEYSSMREQFMRTCEGMIIMYSITNRETFEQVSMFRDQLLHVKDKDHFPMLIVGNQSDQHYDRAVLTQEGMAIATQTGCGFLEASARGNYNVERAFHDIVREIRRYNSEHSLILAMPPELPLTPRKKSPFFSKKLSISSLMKLFKPSKPE